MVLCDQCCVLLLLQLMKKVLFMFESLVFVIDEIIVRVLNVIGFLK